MPAGRHNAVSTQATIIRTRLESNVTVIAVSGELDLASADQLDKAIRDAEQSATGWIVIDLEDLSFLDSTGLSVLLQARRRASENGDRLRFICSRHEQVTRLLSITDTTEFFADPELTPRPTQLPPFQSRGRDEAAGADRDIEMLG
jgi:anti-sigma B factor antagonist